MRNALAALLIPALGFSQPQEVPRPRYLQPPRVVSSALAELLCGLSWHLSVDVFEKWNDTEMDFFRSRVEGGGFLIRTNPTDTGFLFKVETWGFRGSYTSEFRVRLNYSKDKTVEIFIEDCSSSYGTAFKQIQKGKPISLEVVDSPMTAKALLLKLTRMANLINP